MFEKFTEKAINVVIESQKIAAEMHNTVTQPEHLFLAILKQAKGISLKIFKTYQIEYDSLAKAVESRLRFEHSQNESLEPCFSDEYKTLLKRVLDLADKSGNKYILFEHLFLIVINDNKSYVTRILEKFSFNIESATNLLTRLVQKKSKRISHPEASEESLNIVEKNISNAKTFFDSKESLDVFNSAVSRMKEQNYELLGTEQIISSILADSSLAVNQILKNNGVEFDNFQEKSAPRALEFNVGKVLFTPQAYEMMNSAFQVAKELGSSEILPEHVILGLLKSKKGIAYNILKQLDIVDKNIETDILKPIENQMPRTLTILKLAKQEARRLGRNVVGTEMFLLGIISESENTAAKVLTQLEVNIKDARIIIEEMVGFGNEYFETEITFTPRAKKVLEIAWHLAKKENLQRIKSEHLLYAITMMEDSMGMKVLSQLGVDVVEIRQGILKEVGKKSD